MRVATDWKKCSSRWQLAATSPTSTYLANAKQNKTKKVRYVTGIRRSKTSVNKREKKERKHEGTRHEKTNFEG